VSTLRSAIELKSVFDQIAAAEKAGNLTAEEKEFRPFSRFFIFYSKLSTHI